MVHPLSDRPLELLERSFHDYQNSHKLAWPDFLSRLCPAGLLRNIEKRYRDWRELDRFDSETRRLERQQLAKGQGVEVFGSYWGMTREREWARDALLVSMGLPRGLTIIDADKVDELEQRQQGTREGMRSSRDRVDRFLAGLDAWKRDMNGSGMEGGSELSGVWQDEEEEERGATASLPECRIVAEARKRAEAIMRGAEESAGRKIEQAEVFIAAEVDRRVSEIRDEIRKQAETEAERVLQNARRVLLEAEQKALQLCGELYADKSITPAWE